MVFSLIILVLLGAIAFFHYVQGLFSATISAILAILAAVLAISYAEPIVNQYFTSGRFVDYAYSVVLIALFALTYLILRLIFDAALPGNVRFPVVLEKVGAGVMGVIAGIFATGVFAIAAEALPFGTSFGMYSLYEIKQGEKSVGMILNNRPIDAWVFDQLDVTTLEEREKRGGLWIPVNDMVLSMVQHLSDGGSLAGSRELASVHPDLVTELYGQRLGQEVGDKRTVLADAISVTGLYTLDRVRQHSSEVRDVRQLAQNELTPGNNQTILVVRVRLGSNASGAGDIVRFSTGATHIVAGSGQQEDRDWKNYFPVGTLDTSDLLFVSAPDDPLFARANSQVDFVFVIDNGALIARGGDAGSRKVRDGTIFSFKRLGRVDLSGMEIQGAPPRDDTVKVLRKVPVLNDAGRPLPPKT